MQDRQSETSRRGFLKKAGAIALASAGAGIVIGRKADKTFAAESGKQLGGKRDWKKSLKLAMEFLGQAYITDRSHPDYHGFLHMYDSREGKWNLAYMELAWQVIYDALLPYYDYSKDKRWLNQSVGMIVDWGVPDLMCRDPKSPAYGGMLLNNSPETHGATAYEKKYHTFDNGDGLLAFLMVHQRTKDTRIAEGIERVSSFLRRATTEKGQLRTCFNSESGRWSTDPAIFSNSRAAWPYAYWYSITGHEEYKQWAVEYCKWMLQHQRPNGYMSPHGQEVTEFIIYAVEGLYWTGTYCKVPEFIGRAKATFDALVPPEKVWPGNTYIQYRADWRPVEAHVRAGPADGERDLLSTCGQYAKLAYYFWKLTGEDLYRHEYLSTLEAMYDAQDRTSDNPNMLGAWPRASNHPWRRSVCPGYNYVGAVLLDADLVEA